MLIIKSSAQHFDEINKRTSLSCLNGEAIKLITDSNLSTIGFLDYKITSIVRIGDVFFCGSSNSASFLNIKDSTETLKTIGGNFNSKRWRYPSKAYTSSKLKQIPSIIDTIQQVAQPKKVVNIENTEIDELNANLQSIYISPNVKVNFSGYHKGEYFTAYNFERFGILIVFI